MILETQKGPESKEGMEPCVGRMMASDIQAIADAFRAVHWIKPQELFETYYEEQQKEERFVWVAYVGCQCAGYVTLKKKSDYEPFGEALIPEIKDLNVLPAYRFQGIGSKLLVCAEEKAKEYGGHVGLGVGLYGGPDGGYGYAQRLYIKRGYIPDGRGVTSSYYAVSPGKIVCMDDDLLLWLFKKL